MRKLVVTAFVTVDGVVQAPGGPDEDRDGGFEHGGWSTSFFDEDLFGVMTEFVSRAGALLLGRRTYEIFAASWPKAGPDDAIGTVLNSIPKHVASRTLTSVDWQNSSLLAGDVATAVRALKEADGKEIQVHGSGGLIQTLLEHDLVDEWQLVVCPVLLGVGKRLFGPGTVPTGLTLTSSRPAPFGVVLNRYARGGKLEYGEMDPATPSW